MSTDLSKLDLSELEIRTFKLVSSRLDKEIEDCQGIGFVTETDIVFTGWMYSQNIQPEALGFLLAAAVHRLAVK